eukprot:4778384-Karenia_brevis.AAC.1
MMLILGGDGFFLFAKFSVWVWAWCWGAEVGGGWYAMGWWHYAKLPMGAVEMDEGFILGRGFVGP